MRRAKSVPMIAPAGTRAVVPESLAGKLTRQGWVMVDRAPKATPDEGNSGADVSDAPAEEDSLELEPEPQEGSEPAAPTKRPALKATRNEWAAYATGQGKTVPETATKREIIEMVG